MTPDTHIEDHIHQDGFAARLRQLLTSYGSAGALAKAIGRSEGAVRKWTRGLSEPNVSDLRAICEHTGVQVEWLVTGDGPRDRPVPAVHDSAALVYRPAAPQLDYAFLDQLMQALDAQLAEQNVRVTTTKRSTMVVTLYQMFRDTHIIDRDSVARVARLAA